MVDMTSILNKKASAVKPPTQLPVGDYVFRVVSWGSTEQEPEKYKKSKNGNDQVTFECQAEAPIDVPAEMLKDITFPVKMRNTFWITEDGLYHLTDFLGHLKLDLSTQTISELLPASPNKLFKGSVSQRSGDTKPGEEPRLYSQIGKTYPLD